SLLTRSQRVSHENLRLRDREWLEGYERWWAARGRENGGEGERENGGAQGGASPPMFVPFRVRGVTLPNRVAVSPMAMYSAEDGLVTDFHLVHLGQRALGGAGLVFTEMTCVAPDARITPGCAGLWTDAPAAAHARIARPIPANSPAHAAPPPGPARPKGAPQNP